MVKWNEGGVIFIHLENHKFWCWKVRSIWYDGIYPTRPLTQKWITCFPAWGNCSPRMYIFRPHTHWIALQSLQIFSNPHTFQSQHKTSSRLCWKFTQNSRNVFSLKKLLYNCYFHLSTVSLSLSDLTMFQLGTKKEKKTPHFIWNYDILNSYWVGLKHFYSFLLTQSD